VLLVTRLKTRDGRLAHAHATPNHGWSRALLDHPTERRTVERSGKALTNFDRRRPKPQSDLAHESLEDPWRFDIFSLGVEARQRDLETALVKQ
jgi:predicted nuclease of restriction endonuclease-like (RecB) superfamily